MSRVCFITGKHPRRGNSIIRSGKAKKEGGIGRHVTAVTKRKFIPNLQRVKIQLPSGEIRHVVVAATVIKRGQIVKAPKRNWKPEAKKA
ncbi:MAG: 50S ribosomal protein L28 [Pedosphaera sp.]|nr:50S ribosomal protein L28 [Pedosphaera sp.]MSU44248.1 50S ribosomal protein L28 [Pedosphaera sp.]